MAIDYLGSLRSDAAALVEAAGTGSLDASVPGCPGWDVNRLLGHRRPGAPMGRRGVSDRGGASRGSTREAATRRNCGGVVLGRGCAAGGRAGGARSRCACVELLERVLSSDRFWPRRMAIETALHRWDGQDAHGRTTAIDAELASDGMDEVLDVHVGLRLAGATASTSAAPSTSTAPTPRASGRCAPTTAWRG